MITNIYMFSQNWMSVLATPVKMEENVLTSLMAFYVSVLKGSQTHYVQQVSSIGLLPLVFTVRKTRRLKQ